MRRKKRALQIVHRTAPRNRLQNAAPETRVIGTHREQRIVARTLLPSVGAAEGRTVALTVDGGATDRIEETTILPIREATRSEERHREGVMTQRQGAPKATGRTHRSQRENVTR